jgi:hypothetical protein
VREVEFCGVRDHLLKTESQMNEQMNKINNSLARRNKCTAQIIDIYWQEDGRDVAVDQIQAMGLMEERIQKVFFRLRISSLVRKMLKS